MARHSFQPRTSISPRSVLYFPILRAILREISPFIFATLPFSHSVKAFPIRTSLILHALHHLHLSIYFPSAPQPSHPLHSPQFLSHSSPLFHPPPQLTHERAHPRALRSYAYERAHARPSGGFRLLPSPLHPPSQSTVHQHIRCEEKQERAFTKYTTISKSTS